MATNNFKAFGIGAGANVTSQADYEALAALLTGFQSGKASSAQINKALRQSTVMAYVLAQFISDSASVDVLDNGNPATILANLKGSMTALTPGRLLNVRVFSASTPYIKTPGTRKTRWRVIGAGGGGGGAAATGSGQFSAGGGGLAGSYAESPLIDPPADNTAITVGAKGKGGAAGANTGIAGGATSVGSIISAPGGGGGVGGAASAYSNIVAQIGSPTNAPSGSVLFYSRGAPAASVTGFSTGLIKGGDGGASFFGIGGAGGQSVTSSSPSPAMNYGSGGGGAALGQNGSAVAGADGADGLVIVEEYA
ncbi:hypothetical protein ABIE06_001718 [Pantoea dispersa]|uniref:glycine-rich domain-containing protein n=1 Tax=Pantoea dispersa TaxID=59814 RepID=UPI003D1E6CDD